MTVLEAENFDIGSKEGSEIRRLIVSQNGQSGTTSWNVMERHACGAKFELR